MRLWHEKLLTKLSRPHILSQHRECCALRGKGWGRKHATVDYVFKHDYIKLYYYHVLVMKEMRARGYKPDKIWDNPQYRGKILKYDLSDFTKEDIDLFTSPVYGEHDEQYLQECIDRLIEKGYSENVDFG